MSFFRQSWPRAAKPYRCQECGGRIETGERHRYVAFISEEGDFCANRTCDLCGRLANEASKAFGLDTWELGELWSILTDDFGVLSPEAWLAERGGALS